MTNNMLYEVLHYVIGDPMFWGSMGFTTAIGMILSGIMFQDSNASGLARGLIILVAFIGLMLLVQIERVYPQVGWGVSHAWAPVITLVLVGMFYGLGLVLGYLVVNRRKILYTK